MHKNKKLRIITIIIFLVLISITLSCTLSDFINRYPAAGFFVAILFVADKAAIQQMEEQKNDDYEGPRMTYWDKYTDLLLTGLDTYYDFSDKNIKTAKIVGTNKDFKPIEATPTANIATLSALQGSYLGSITISEEDMEGIKDNIETLTGTIVLDGYIKDAPNATFTMKIDFDTGKISGKWSSVTEVGESSGDIDGIFDKEKLGISGTFIGDWKFLEYSGEVERPMPFKGSLDIIKMIASGIIIDVEGSVYEWIAE